MHTHIYIQARAHKHAHTHTQTHVHTLQHWGCNQKYWADVLITTFQHYQMTGFLQLLFPWATIPFPINPNTTHRNCWVAGMKTPSGTTDKRVSSLESQTLCSSQLPRNFWLPWVAINWGFVSISRGWGRRKQKSSSEQTKTGVFQILRFDVWHAGVRGTHIHTHTHTHTHTRCCRRSRVRSHTRTHTCTHLHTHTYTHTWAHAITSSHTHIQTFSHTYAYTRARTHARPHTHARMP